jgi:cyclic beta-1,2-glucan synthetase
MKTSTLIAYFAKRDEARESEKALWKKGYRRIAWVSKSVGGELRTRDPYFWRCTWRGLVAFLIGACFLSVVFPFFGRLDWLPAWPPLLIPILLGGVLGMLLSSGRFQRARFGVERALLENHARWLVPGETVLILQGPTEIMHIATAVMLEHAELPPKIFVLHPKRDCLIQRGWAAETPLNPTQLQEHALHLATEYPLDPRPLKNAALLKWLERGRRRVQQVCLDLSEASRLEQSLPPIAEWLLDNEYILESNARDVRMNLPWRYYRQLPALANEPYDGLPRIYALARELAAHSDLRVDQDNILAFFETYQNVKPLSIGELWSVPQMLRTALIEGIQQLAARASAELREREFADFWANRLISANRRDPNQLFALMAELTAVQPNPSPYFAAQLYDFLFDEAAALAPVQSWLERTFQKSMHDLIMREKNRQTKDQLSIGNAFTSLRQLALLDWQECFERLSSVERILRQDPAGIYPAMNFTTRNRYRQAIEDLRRGSGMPEEQVAQSAVDLAACSAPNSAEDEWSNHVGTYLIGAGRAQLARLIGCRETMGFLARHWAYRHHSTVYFLGFAFTSAAILLPMLLFCTRGQAPVLQALIALLLLIPASQLALEILNYLIMRLFPPRPLPRLDFRTTGIPDAFRTLVVVPMMLMDEETIRAEAEKLEIRYLANKEANLLFGLFSDFMDASELECKSDAALLQAARDCITALNELHGNARFFLLHRGRKWCETEQKYIGWERKRGKLEELNDLIIGTRPPGAERLVYVGDADQLTNVRFVITLDSDTQLPHDTARKLIETLAHPLNQPRFDRAGRVAAGSYTIIQPRVSPSLPSTSGSPFSRLFSDPVGIDPYTNAVSDAYQDLTGEGSYHGKGIYDVRAFSRVLKDRFPEACLLSHDLIEGAHVRVGLASDIELYDEFPQDYLSYIKRQHRWVRGDWQIAAWTLPRVPVAGGGRGPNPLSWFDRWKVFDNLRRSLLPASSLALLLACWLASFRAGWVATLVVAAQLFFHSLAQSFTWATAGQSFKTISFAKIAHDLLRVLVEAALLPYQAWLALDAIARVLYRKTISHRKLLEWTSAQAMHRGAKARVPIFLLSMSFVSFFSPLVAAAIMRWRPENIAVAAPWLALWCLSLLIAWLLIRRPRAVCPQYLLPAADRYFMRNVARRTWRYFSDFVNEDTSWLPPDNYQVSYQNQLAMRTSPTNIGLYLVSVLSARDFGYLTIDGVAQRLTRTMETIAKLERHEGHLLNWYDIKTLAPLRPRYVSTVDSGNLLGALWTLVQGLETLVRTPLLDAQALAGLRDVGDILRQFSLKSGNPSLNTETLGKLLHEWETPSETVMDALRRLHNAEEPVAELSARAGGLATSQAAVTYWSGQLQHQLTDWLVLEERYLLWLGVLAEKSEEDITALDPAALSAFQQALHEAPSLADLAEGNIACIIWLRGLQQNATSGPPDLRAWIERVIAAFERSKWLAGEMLTMVMQIVQTCRELADSVNMHFLYNADRRLFSIGFNVSEGRLDRAFYDLLASEARLGSFVAIARGDIPAHHWFAMSRPYGAIGRRRALLSWTGTMFEYLLPNLFQRCFGNTLLDKAAREAVAIQIAYGRKQQVPWGISECAFGDLDLNKTYQYYAFGVPELGLKRGAAEKIVVAPYATMLAISLAPREAVQNLRRLADLKLLSDYGYYESLDYSRQPNRPGETGVIVRAYMAHHQAMSFLALTNFLHDDCLQRHFHADARVRTFEPLLHERIPHLPPLHHISTRERITSVAAIGEVAPSVSQFDTPHTGTPKTQLLSNGRYALMVTGAGGGYSRWGGIEITRWRSDTTRDAWGTFCYIHDVDLNRLWCNSFHPTGGKVDHYCVNFTLDRAEFRRVDHDIESETEIIVAPEDDVEIRRMTLINRSPRPRRLNLTSYAELAMAAHGADLQHPAFNKLFIQTEALPEQRALLAWRRPRSSSEAPVFVAHRFTLESAGPDENAERITAPLHYETDRRRFIGRGRTLANPMGALGETGNNHGFVLDPILSLRQELTLAAGQRVQVSLILAATPSREQAVSLMNKYGDPHAIDRAMDFAWESAQLELRLLRIQPDEARRFQQLASHLLFPNPLLRSSTQRITENRKGQAGLWAYSISGDLPLALITVGEMRDLGLVRQILQAHGYWRMHGLMADLVILNEETGGYLQPLREALERLIQSHSSMTGIDRPGGVYLRSAELIPVEDLTLLRAVANIALVAARGSLPQQLSVPALESPALPEPVIRRRDPRDPSAALPFMQLLFFNSLGGFTPDGREYAIYLGPGIHTPAPWVNVIANPNFGTLISETGAGFTWQGNSQRNRLTQWSNDPVMDPAAEAIYLRDEETGIYWTPTAAPIREEPAYRARHGAGYTAFEHNSHGIQQQLTVFVPVDDQGGKPIKLQRLILFNESGRPRRLSLTYYVEWTLGESRESSQMQIVTAWDDEAQALLARNYFNPDYGNQVAFAALSLPAASYTADRTVFLGRNRSLSNPAALERTRLSRRTGAGFDPCAALQVNLKLAPGERVEITCMLGQTATPDQVHALLAAYRETAAVETALRETQAWWEHRLSAIQVRTPEQSADLLINRWLLYQSLSCRMWGRSGFYQSGGAYGFRDQLQDAMALLYAAPQLAREHILLAASRQFAQGDVQHWWHPPGGAGIRSRISDDLLWLPFVVAQYVRVTGDVNLLHEMLPFLEAPLLNSDQHESFQQPAVSLERASLFEHCRRALAHGQTAGIHGLPLMGTGDWNDGMNLVGAGGKGESVWLGWFLVDVLHAMSELSDLVEQPALGLIYRSDRAALLRHIEKFAWDGAWYLRATFDDGTPLGAASSAEAQIDSLPQSWAWLSGAADSERAALALDAAWNHLVLEDEGLVLLFEPPFDQTEQSPGYIKGYPPGVRENGGQYTHAAVWFAMALARRGDGTRAAKILRMLNPIEHAREPESVWRYGIEPYAIAADVYRLPGRTGQGGWSWYTGSAAWMYRAWVEDVLGLQVRGDTLRLSPVIPAWWDGFQLSYRHGEALYEIEVENPDHCERGVAWAEFDGQNLPTATIPLARDLIKHHIRIRMGTPPHECGAEQERHQ